MHYTGKNFVETETYFPRSLFSNSGVVYLKIPLGLCRPYKYILRIALELKVGFL